MDGTFVVQKGRKETICKRKEHIGLAATEGKKPFPFRAYEYLAKQFFESDEPEHVTTHNFLVLEWNIISRAEYVVDSNIYLVYFQYDVVLFNIGKTTMDQEGKKILTTHGMSIPILNTLKFVHF